MTRNLKVYQRADLLVWAWLPFRSCALKIKTTRSHPHLRGHAWSLLAALVGFQLGHVPFANLSDMLVNRLLGPDWIAGPQRL